MRWRDIASFHSVRRRTEAQAERCKAREYSRSHNSDSGPRRSGEVHSKRTLSQSRECATPMLALTGADFKSLSLKSDGRSDPISSCFEDLLALFIFEASRRAERRGTETNRVTRPRRVSGVVGKMAGDTLAT